MKIRIGNIPLLKNWQHRIRRKRINLFLSSLKPVESWSILDVGGTWPTWRIPGLKLFRVTLLNLRAVKLPDDLSGRLVSIAGDACALDYNDKQFDLIFSNSVIEHVGTFENQKRFSSEVRRVGKALWVQTPAKEFFFEPHYLTPFIHWIPRVHRGKFVRWGTIWGIFWKPSKAKVAERVDEIRLLKRCEMEELFPDCEIYEEKFFGLTKSYVAIRR